MLAAKENEISKAELELIERARRAPASENWAQLSGKIYHKKRNLETKEHSIYLGMRFTSEMIFAQITIDNIETYTISQGFNSKTPTIIKEGDMNSKVLEQIGLRPEELTMSFLFWEPVKFSGDKIFKTSKCAEIEFFSEQANERAVVLLNREYAFPLKVEWFENKNELLRTMEIGSFKKENNYWIVDEILIYGPGWRTKVAFTDVKVGSASDGIPSDLFRKTLPIEN